MKFLLLSDVHLATTNPIARLDNTIETQWKKLKFVFDYAWENYCVILQAGDFSDTPRSWILLAQLSQFLRSYGDVNVFTIFGQHDTYLYSEERRGTTITGVLEKAGRLTILGQEPARINVGNVELYGQSYGESTPKPQNTSTVNILVVHDNVSLKKLPHSHKNAQKYLRNRKLYDLILCGDIHRKFRFTVKGPRGLRTIVNTGPMVRRVAEKSVLGHRPGFYVFDSKKRSVKWVGIPHEKPEMVLTRKHIETKEEKQTNLTELTDAIKQGFKGPTTKLEANLLAYYEEHETDARVIDLLESVMEKDDE